MKNLIYLLASLILFSVNSKTLAQSYLLAGGQLDGGFLQNASFQNGALSNRTSTSYGFGLDVEFRYRSLFSIQTGFAQNFNKLRFKDALFEETYTSHTMRYSQKSAFLNYFAGVQVLIPVHPHGWIYAKCTYSIPIDRAETINKTYDYEILKEGVDNTIIASSTFHKRIPSFIPEIGFQAELEHSIFLSLGMKMDFSQQNVIVGSYALRDNYTSEIVRNDQFNFNGNSFSFYTKLSFPLHEFIKSVTPKPEKPKKEPKKEEEIIVKVDKNKTDKDIAKIEHDEKGVPTTINDRTIPKIRTVYVESDSITIKVWDNGKEVDGDSISLNLNGEWILKDYRLERRQLALRVAIDRKKDNYLIIYALNLGTAPPNTAAVTVYDGVRTQSMKLESDMGACGALNIVKR